MSDLDLEVLLERWSLLRERARWRFRTEHLADEALFDFGFRAGWALAVQVGYFDGIGQGAIAEAVVMHARPTVN